MNLALFWDIALGGLYLKRRFGGKWHKATCCTLVSCPADFLPWRWRWYVPPKRRFSTDNTVLYPGR
jgi:hypothetical protein